MTLKNIKGFGVWSTVPLLVCQGRGGSWPSPEILGVMRSENREGVKEGR